MISKTNITSLFPLFKLTIGVFIFLVSCKKEELPVPKHDPGHVVTTNVNMEANYKWQIYFDLKTNSVVGQNLKTLWDLGFETADDGYRIVLNTSKAMYALNTMSTNFTSIVDTNGLETGKKWDAPSGNMDSTAIGNWENSDHVYVIDRGYDEMGIHQGFRKIQFQSVDASKYIVRFAELNGTNDVSLQINKDSIYNFSFLSFTTGNVMLVEPPKKNWDLVFTQYTHVFHNPLTPYLVTGCLLNRYKTTAVMENTIPFSNLDYKAINNYTFLPIMNTIGYNWKAYVGSTYVTDPTMNYIIKDSENYYYKLHFIDFYNQSGTKGNPKWEFQQL